MNNPKTNKRVEIAGHCETIGNALMAQVDGTRFMAGKTAILFVSYWYVKYVRADKQDVVLFTNPLDWLHYMETLTPLDAWKAGRQFDGRADNPTFAQLQYLTHAVENGDSFAWLGMRIWARLSDSSEQRRYRYYFAIGEKIQCFGTRGGWRKAIKPYLWEWRIEKGDDDEESNA